MFKHFMEAVKGGGDDIFCLDTLNRLSLVGLSFLTTYLTSPHPVSDIYTSRIT